MKVSDLINGETFVLTPDQTLKEAAELFLEKHIDGAPIVDPDGRLLGLVSKSNLYRAIVEEEDFNQPVTNYMHTDLITTGMDENMDNVKKLEVGRVPVVEDDKLVGMVTQSDLIAAYTRILDDLTQKLNTVIDSAYNAIVSIDQEGIITIFNSPAEKMFGIKKEAALGKPFREVVPHGDLLQILKRGDIQTGQRFSHNNRTFLSNRSPIMVDGKVTGAVAVVQEIAELQSVLDELEYIKQLKTETDAIIDSSFDGIYVTDGSGKTLMINEAYSRITGIKTSEVMGRTMHQLVEAGVFDRSATLMVMEHKKPITTTQEVKTGKTVLVTGNPIYDERGNLFRVVTNVRDITELNSLKQEVDEAQRWSRHYKEQLKKMKIQDCNKYVIKSKKSKELIDLVMRLGHVDSTVLVQGESGVGKEMVADILHKNSIRKDKPLIRINCGAIPDNLLESELFGYESGSFTGAKKGGKIGIFEMASGGSLFLDEIGELPLTLQVKLLRVIQEREITRIGGNHPVSVDVRLIAATNRDLWQMVVENRFRKDLFYRLNVVPVVVVPLRERKEEIPALANHFLAVFNQKYAFQKVFDESVMLSLMDYDWPGNVRELENVIERAIVTSSETVIREIKLPNDRSHKIQNELWMDLSEGMNLKEAMERVEKRFIQQYLQRCGSTRKTAAALGVSQPTIVRKAARYGICLKD
ncbi:MAG: sigma 54-interacting transcriptional regulator [Bacillota bacterium]|nr:sigma 54-interacting transcriptional regulator [Bacillota bacterium]